MEDIELLFSDENESGDYDESNDVNFCYNMLWIKVVNVIVSFLRRFVFLEFVLFFRIRI